jgi:hypothetical protein
MVLVSKYNVSNPSPQSQAWALRIQALAANLIYRIPPKHCPSNSLSDFRRSSFPAASHTHECRSQSRPNCCHFSLLLNNTKSRPGRDYFQIQKGKSCGAGTKHAEFDWAVKLILPGTENGPSASISPRWGRCGLVWLDAACN